MIEKEQHVYRTIQLWNCHHINMLMYINANNTVSSSLIKTIIFNGLPSIFNGLDTETKHSDWAKHMDI